MVPWFVLHKLWLGGSCLSQGHHTTEHLNNRLNSTLYTLWWVDSMFSNLSVQKVHNLPFNDYKLPYPWWVDSNVLKSLPVSHGQHNGFHQLHTQKRTLHEAFLWDIIHTSSICLSRPPMSLYCSVGLSSNSMAFTLESNLCQGFNTFNTIWPLLTLTHLTLNTSNTVNTNTSAYPVNTNTSNILFIMLTLTSNTNTSNILC